MQIVSQQPEMSQHINYYNFMLDLARRMGLDDIDQFIVEQNPNALPVGAEGEEMGGNPEEAAVQSMSSEIGQPGANAVRNQVMADGGASMMSQMFGQEGAQITPEMMAQFAQ